MTTNPDEQLRADLRKVLSARETAILSSMATPSDRALRRRPESKLDIDYRTAFAVDTDRILHSRAYTRYIDKTQVFYLVDNDHITHRVLHVQLVAKIARTMGRCLGLNELSVTMGSNFYPACVRPMVSVPFTTMSRVFNFSIGSNARGPAGISLCKPWMEFSVMTAKFIPPS